MAYTQTQLDTLEAAIAEGAFKVKYSDKEVTYRSLNEMKQIRDMMRESLGVIDSGMKKTVHVYDKGLG